ncbi:hypothetical protein EJ06DRAFT_534866 [Trichodelitschia bisporula]|uniref:Uncharacterized protein n=1 Tax=Trichodelitschia bisporula TaxID=703511 RepID=A0A6G1HHQ4_9PEZI|nr:hypothetical protein EJ06DRAFT_534866 [Trichodelitschia bisporula]
MHQLLTAVSSFLPPRSTLRQASPPPAANTSNCNISASLLHRSMPAPAPPTPPNRLDLDPTPQNTLSTLPLEHDMPIPHAARIKLPYNRICPYQAQPRPACILIVHPVRPRGTELWAG